jgi:hypothetical protein
MKRIYTSLLLFILVMSSVSQAQDTVPILEGSYLGQKPLSLTPEPFAPGIVTTKDWEVGARF